MKQLFIQRVNGESINLIQAGFLLDVLLKLADIMLAPQEHAIFMRNSAMFGEHTMLHQIHLN